jgi:hypothetical protein
MTIVIDAVAASLTIVIDDSSQGQGLGAYNHHNNS